MQGSAPRVDDKPCPAIEGIEKEGQTLIKKVEDGVVDAVILSGAADTEHHEISVYEGLITNARAMGEEDVIALLQENLEQEQHTGEEVKRASTAARAGAGAADGLTTLEEAAAEPPLFGHEPKAERAWPSRHESPQNLSTTPQSPAIGA